MIESINDVRNVTTASASKAWREIAERK